MTDVTQVPHDKEITTTVRSGLANSLKTFARGDELNMDAAPGEYEVATVFTVRNTDGHSLTVTVPRESSFSVIRDSFDRARDVYDRYAGGMNVWVIYIGPDQYQYDLG